MGHAAGRHGVRHGSRRGPNRRWGGFAHPGRWPDVRHQPALGRSRRTDPRRGRRRSPTPVSRSACGARTVPGNAHEHVAQPAGGGDRAAGGRPRAGTTVVVPGHPPPVDRRWHARRDRGAPDVDADAATLDVEVALGADFAHVFDVKGGRHRAPGRCRRRRGRLVAAARSTSTTSTWRRVCAGPPAAVADPAAGTLRWHLELAPRGSATISISVDCRRLVRQRGRRRRRSIRRPRRSPSTASRAGGSGRRRWCPPTRASARRSIGRSPISLRCASSTRDIPTGR